MVATAVDEGLLVGILVGEGHFGGDGKQPQVTLRMHVRHEALFRWIERTFPGGRLYGPYHHDGRHYFQWMARGSFLANQLLPILERHLTPAFDEYAFHRLEEMRRRYAQRLAHLSTTANHAATEPAQSGQEPGELTPRRSPATSPQTDPAPASMSASMSVSVSADSIFAVLRGDSETGDRGDHRPSGS